MKHSRHQRSLIAIGLISAATVVGAGTIYAAAGGGASEDNQDEFSTDRLKVFTDIDTEKLPEWAPQEMVEAGGGHLVVDTDELRVYLTERDDGSVCVLAQFEWNEATTCGTIETIAAGELVLRSQATSLTPATYVGVVSNDVREVHTATAKVEPVDNVWVATTEASDWYIEVVGVDRSVVVNDLPPESSKPAGTVPEGDD